MYEAKSRRYDSVLNKIEDKLKRVEDTDTDSYVTAYYIMHLAEHSGEIFRCSEYEERRALIRTVLLNGAWNGEALLHDYK